MKIILAHFSQWHMSERNSLLLSRSFKSQHMTCLCSFFSLSQDWQWLLPWDWLYIVRAKLLFLLLNVNEIWGSFVITTHPSFQIYSWSLNNGEVRGANNPQSWKSTCNFIVSPPPPNMQCQICRFSQLSFVWYGNTYLVKKFTYKWTQTVQIHVVQGSTVVLIILYTHCFLLMPNYMGANNCPHPMNPISVVSSLENHRLFTLSQIQCR